MEALCRFVSYCFFVLFRETGDLFLAECPIIGGISRRTKDVLLKIIQEHVHVGTTILTDGWAAYRSLPELGAWIQLHYTVVYCTYI